MHLNPGKPDAALFEAIEIRVENAKDQYGTGPAS